MAGVVVNLSVLMRLCCPDFLGCGGMLRQCRDATGVHVLLSLHCRPTAYTHDGKTYLKEHTIPAHRGAGRRP